MNEDATWASDQTACLQIQRISTYMYLKSLGLWDISELSDENSEPQRSRRKVWRAVWLIHDSPGFLCPGSLRLCTVTYVGSHTSPLPHYAASHSSCLKNKQWVASVLIINVLGERKVLMWGNKTSLISNSIINLNQTYAAFITLSCIIILHLNLLSLPCHSRVFGVVINQTDLWLKGPWNLVEDRKSVV